MFGMTITLIMQTANSHVESNGSAVTGDHRSVRSVPGSPRGSSRQYSEVIGSAESLVERVSHAM